MQSRSLMRFVAALYLALVWLSPLRVSAQTISFDDLSGSNQPIPSGYEGLEWNGFRSLAGNTFVPIASGYGVGVISPANVAYNYRALPAFFEAAAPFTFHSVYLTAAWRDGLSVSIQGYNGANLLNQQTVQLSSTAPTQLSFDWSGLTKVQFESSGGVRNPNYLGDGAHFAMDNLVVSFGGPPDIEEIPEPGSLALMTAGILPLGLLRRKKLSRRERETPHR